MKDVFELAAGSVAGRDHRLEGRNNQDAAHMLQLPQATVAVVCDGCGSGRHSEVGAALGSRLIVQAIVENDLDKLNEPAFWEAIREHVLRDLDALARRMGGPRPAILEEFFLFTVVGAVMVPAGAAFFSLGDGLIVVNGERIPLGPFPNNAPPYLGYGTQSFTVHRTLPTDTVDHFLIGTDGVFDLVAAADKPLPGKDDLVGPIERLWTDDRFFANPDRLRRHLALANRDVVRGDRHERGLLSDDTTIVAGRRRKEAG